MRVLRPAAKSPVLPPADPKGLNSGEGDHLLSFLCSSSQTVQMKINHNTGAVDPLVDRNLDELLRRGHCPARKGLLSKGHIYALLKISIFADLLGPVLFVTLNFSTFPRFTFRGATVL